MFNVGFGELVFILGLALLVLGPRKLPELARGIGRFMREFRRQSEDIRQTVEREFYKLDRELEDPLPKLGPPEGTFSAAPLHQAPALPADPNAVDPNEALHAAYPEAPTAEMVALTERLAAQKAASSAIDGLEGAAPAEASTSASGPHPHTAAPDASAQAGAPSHDGPAAQDDAAAAPRTSAAS